MKNKVTWISIIFAVALVMAGSGSTPVVVPAEIDLSKSTAAEKEAETKAAAQRATIEVPKKKKRKGEPPKHRLKKPQLETRCDAGVASACTMLAGRYLEEEEFDQVPLTLQKACLYNDPVGCEKYGDQTSGAEAALAFKKACDGGVATACKKLLPMTELLPPSQRPGTARSSPVPESFRGSQLTYEGLCDRSVEECASKGLLLLDTAERERGLVLLRGACDRRFAPACLKQAVDFEKSGDSPRALREYLKACDLDRADACEKAKQMKKQGFVPAP